MAQLDAYAIQDMASHWLGTPPNGYLGSGYGSNVQDLLQDPLRSGAADAFIDKLVKDVPILDALPNGAVNVYQQNRPNTNDAKDVYLEIADSLVKVENINRDKLAGS